MDLYVILHHDGWRAPEDPQAVAEHALSSENNGSK